MLLTTKSVYTCYEAPSLPSPGPQFFHITGFRVCCCDSQPSERPRSLWTIITTSVGVAPVSPWHEWVGRYKIQEYNAGCYFTVIWGECQTVKVTFWGQRWRSLTGEGCQSVGFSEYFFNRSTLSRPACVYCSTTEYNQSMMQYRFMSLLKEKKKRRSFCFNHWALLSLKSDPTIVSPVYGLLKVWLNIRLSSALSGTEVKGQATLLSSGWQWCVLIVHRKFGAAQLYLDVY